MQKNVLKIFIDWSSFNCAYKFSSVHTQKKIIKRAVFQLHGRKHFKKWVKMQMNAIVLILFV